MVRIKSCYRGREEQSYGWGHDKDGLHLQHAQRIAGASCNDLTDEMVVDQLSGNAVLNGVPVTIRKA